MKWHRPNSPAGRITSPFGPRGPIAGAPDASRYHLGVDLRAGTLGVTSDIYAAASGTVRRIYRTPLGAWVLELDHGAGIWTRYVHMQRAGIAVKVGDRVAGGQRVAAASNSGAPTIHLHFEVLIGGKQVDPVPWLKARGVDLTVTTAASGAGTSAGLAGADAITLPTITAPPSAPDVQEDEMFRIRVSAGITDAKQHGDVYLVQFGGTGQAMFKHLTPQQDAVCDIAGIPKTDVTQGMKDIIRLEVIQLEAAWKVN